jgi:hypothetical protein
MTDTRAWRDYTALFADYLTNVTDWLSYPDYRSLAAIRNWV